MQLVLTYIESFPFAIKFTVSAFLLAAFGLKMAYRSARLSQ